MDAKRITTIARDQSDGLQTFGVRRWALDVGRLLPFPFNRPSSAFTLVELMVVVAIIAVLLMLLMPNIRTMREKAWSTNCQNNLRQYGIAMNQYMADWNGDFVYAGAGGQDHGAGGVAKGGGWDTTLGDGVINPKDYPEGVFGRSGAGLSSSDRHDWTYMIAYITGGVVTIQSLADGQASVRVCPAVIQQIKKSGNFFDPDSPSFKGYSKGTFLSESNQYEVADFEHDYDTTNNKIILMSYFTTYAINPCWLYKNKKDIPQNVVAFIDWNARDGWWATLSYTTWRFDGTNSQGVAVAQDTPKWTNAWWLTEVGFHHLGKDNVYGANYVAMDGHIGWIGSNTISITNFTGP